MNTTWIKQQLTNKQVQGAVMVLIDKNGTIIDQYIYNDDNTPYQVSLNTRFGIASMTKSFTSLAILKCQQMGLLNINDPVSKYLPELTDSSILIKHFMSHTSGFYPQKRQVIKDYLNQHPNISDTIEFAYDPDLANYGRKAVIDQLNQQTDRCGHPGEHLSYFNDGYALLSEIIRSISTYDSFARFLNEKIFKPLKMSKTTLEFLSVNQDANTTDQFYIEDNTVQQIKDYHDNAFVLHGGGAIKSTIEDLIHWVTMYLNQSEIIVSKELLQLQLNHDTTISPNRYYGYGLEAYQVKNRWWHGHGGSLTGVSSSMIFDIEQGIGCIVLTNTSGFNASEVSRKILANYLQIDDNPTLDYQQWSQDMLDTLYGRYQALEGYQLIITNEGVVINDTVYPFKTLSNHQIVYYQNDTPQFISLIISQQQIKGIRFGLRILSKINES